jgi:hypothetical protein
MTTWSHCGNQVDSNDHEDPAKIAASALQLVVQRPWKEAKSSFGMTDRTNLVQPILLRMMRLREIG